MRKVEIEEIFERHKSLEKTADSVFFSDKYKEFADLIAQLPRADIAALLKGEDDYYSCKVTRKIFNEKETIYKVVPADELGIYLADSWEIDRVKKDRQPAEFVIRKRKYLTSDGIETLN